MSGLNKWYSHNKDKRYALLNFENCENFKDRKVFTVVKNSDYDDPNFDAKKFGYDPDINSEFTGTLQLDYADQNIKKDIKDALPSIIPQLYFKYPTGMKIVICHIQKNKIIFVRVNVSNGKKDDDDIIDYEIDDTHRFQYRPQNRHYYN